MDMTVIVKTYPTTGPQAFYAPWDEPKDKCGSREGMHVCNRMEGHHLAHAHIRYQFHGAVRAVWRDN